MMNFAITVVLMAALMWAAISDWRTRRIPNVVTVGGMLLGLGVSLLPGGTEPLSALLGIGLAFFAFFPLYALRGLGAGDVKLLMAAGAFMGPLLLLRSLIPIALIGGVMAFVAVLRAGMLTRTLASTGALALNLATFGRKGQRVTLSTPGTVAIPYGVAIALGVGAVWLLGLG